MATLTAMDVILKGNPADLIREVRIRRAIWDLKNPAHHNRDIVQKQWKEIEDKLGLPLDYVKNKWKHLRDNFRSELKKTVKGSEGLGRPYQSQWVFFEDLQFLEEQMMKKITRLYTPVLYDDGYNYDVATNDSEVSEGDNACNTSSFLGHSVFVDESEAQDPNNWWQHNTSENYAMTSDYGSGENKRRRLSNDNDGNAAIDIDNLESTKTKPQVNYDDVTDDDFHFMMSLLPYVRMVQGSQKMRMRLRIQQLICEFVYKVNFSTDNSITNSKTPNILLNQQQNHRNSATKPEQVPIKKESTLQNGIGNCRIKTEDPLSITNNDSTVSNENIVNCVVKTEENVVQIVHIDLPMKIDDIKKEVE